jgi:hypothetical protein
MRKVAGWLDQGFRCVVIQRELPLQLTNALPNIALRFA